MARPHRLRIAGLTQHVIQRGNNKLDIFRSASDYEIFLVALHNASLRHPIEVHAYALMTNHVHLLLTPLAANAVSKVMQSVGRRYVQYFNRRYSRTGGLFEGRYRSMVIDTEAYWFTCMRYVELNPVRAGLASGPNAYPWTSYRTSALGVPDRLIVPHSSYLALGASPAARQETWREICAEALTGEQLAEVRSAVHRGGALGGVLIGSGETTDQS